MTPYLLSIICEPITKKELTLINPVYDTYGNIESGSLITNEGSVYPIINGIPRFEGFVPNETVSSFGDQWNHYNFTDFKINWLNHTVANTFGNPDVFKDKIIVDAGGGSGAQTKWFLEYGAQHVILLELSHSVDDVVKRNLSEFSNYDVIQCSIDAPPLKDDSIQGIVYCHNVIQHTPSVEKTAHELFRLIDKNGEFVFNCYGLNDLGPIRWIRINLIYRPLRGILSRMPFWVNKLYAHTISIFRMIPILGWFLEKTGIVVQGDVPIIPGESFWNRLKRRYKCSCLNTFDGFGSHKYQHLKRDDEMWALIKELQPDMTKVLNTEKYFSRPTPIGIALRIRK
ncbi:MAG: methyltransferase domain-containing protein [Chitinophagia bacterium]|jgi:ubiquinone/menaquinone biosynthesis C-methylase UbiE/uncharacterized protein YbaR (Trm112 family)